MESGESETCYSSNMEDYYADLQEVIEGVIGDYSEDSFPMSVTFGEADSKKHTISDFFDLDCLFEDAQQRASDECGEWVDGWLDNIKLEDRIALTQMIESWARLSDNQPKFFSVENARHITVEILNSDGDYKIIETNEKDKQVSQ